MSDDFGERYRDAALGSGLEKPRVARGRAGRWPRRNNSFTPGSSGQRRIHDWTLASDKRDVWEPNRTPAELRRRG